MPLASHLRCVALALGISTALGCANRNQPAPRAESLDPGLSRVAGTRGDALPAQWWTLYQDPGLNHLVAAALRHNRDLAAADAHARALLGHLRGAQGERWPRTEVGYGYQYGRDGDDQTLAEATDEDLHSQWKHTARLDLSYQLDLWGEVRARIAAAKADAEAAQAARDLLRVSHTGLLLRPPCSSQSGPLAWPRRSRRSRRPSPSRRRAVAGSSRPSSNRRGRPAPRPRTRRHHSCRSLARRSPQRSRRSRRRGVSAATKGLPRDAKRMAKTARRSGMDSASVTGTCCSDRLAKRFVQVEGGPPATPRRRLAHQLFQRLRLVEGGVNRCSRQIHRISLLAIPAGLLALGCGPYLMRQR